MTFLEPFNSGGLYMAHYDVDGSLWPLPPSSLAVLFSMSVWVFDEISASVPVFSKVDYGNCSFNSTDLGCCLF